MHVEQEHENGCAVASVAMLTDKTYDEACKLLHGSAHTRDREATLSQCARAIRKAGHRCAITHRLDFSKRMMLMFEWQHDPGCWHTCVWDPHSQDIDDPASGWSYCPVRKHECFRYWERSGKKTIVLQ